MAVTKNTESKSKVELRPLAGFVIQLEKRPGLPFTLEGWNDLFVPGHMAYQIIYDGSREPYGYPKAWTIYLLRHRIKAQVRFDTHNPCTHILSLPQTKCVSRIAIKERLVGLDRQVICHLATWDRVSEQEEETKIWLLFAGYQTGRI